jgi:ABC-type uncharacterized transport system ATPase subunit
MLTVENLTKRYGGTTAVSEVSFSCAPGTLTGFLGPDGAGKSTTLRMLTGLTPPTAGASTIAGRRYADLPNPGRVVGVVLDAAAQHAGRTGRETLRLGAGLLGVPVPRAEEMLERVGLADAAKRRVGQYSLGAVAVLVYFIAPTVWGPWPRRRFSRPAPTDPRRLVGRLRRVRADREPGLRRQAARVADRDRGLDRDPDDVGAVVQLPP